MRLARRAHRAADVRLRGVGDLRERLLGGRVDDGERLARLRRPELVADEQPVLGLDVDVVGRLGRGGVLPRHVAGAEAPRGGRRAALALLGERHVDLIIAPRGLERSRLGGGPARRGLPRRACR